MPIDLTATNKVSLMPVTSTQHSADAVELRRLQFLTPGIYWLQLRFDFDSTAVRRPFDCLSKVIKVATVT